MRFVKMGYFSSRIIFLQAFLQAMASVRHLSPRAFYEPCKVLCDEHRPKGSTDAFSIKCDDSTFGKVCEEICFHCESTEICDFRVKPFVIHCPPREELLRGRCKLQCDLVRKRLSDEEIHLGDLSFSCHNATLFPTDVDKTWCQDVCSDCLEDICDTKESMYHCPAITALTGGCKQQCDYRRPEGYFGPYVFSCYHNVSLSPWEMRQCHRDCSECPGIICHLTWTNDQFYCIAVKESEYVRPPPPPAEPSYQGSRCERRCNKARPPGKREDAEKYEFKFDCSEKYKAGTGEWRNCRYDCYSCPLSVCDPAHHIDQFDHTIYYCPPLQRIPTPAPNDQKSGAFIASWTIIALITVAVIACILAVGYFGRIRHQAVERILPSEAAVQSQQTERLESRKADQNFSDKHSIENDDIVDLIEDI